jgi:hypothetical protein
VLAGDSVSAEPDRGVDPRAAGPERQHRAVATRYDKRDFVWRGTIDVASIRIWLRTMPHDLKDTLQRADHRVLGLFAGRRRQQPLHTQRTVSPGMIGDRPAAHPGSAVSRADASAGETGLGISGRPDFQQRGHAEPGYLH